MKTRLLTAAALIPVLLVVVMFLPKLVMTIILALFSALAAYELLYATGLLRQTRLMVYTMVSAFLMPLYYYFEFQEAIGLLGMLAFISVLFVEMLRNHVRVRFESIVLCLAAGLLIPYLFSALIRLYIQELGRYLVMLAIILAFLPDSGAYFAGHYFGAHKLAAVISPKKTVEGAIGGVITAVVAMLVYALILDFVFYLDVSYGLAVLYGVIASVGAIFGDLMFSAIKRQNGIKDYGRIFPGHGGILDRFDSMIIVAPLTEALLLLIPVVV